MQIALIFLLSHVMVTDSTVTQYAKEQRLQRLVGVIRTQFRSELRVSA